MPTERYVPRDPRDAQDFIDRAFAHDGWGLDGAEHDQQHELLGLSAQPAGADMTDAGSDAALRSTLLRDGVISPAEARQSAGLSRARKDLSLEDRRAALAAIAHYRQTTTRRQLMSTNPQIDPADLQPAIDALTQAASSLQSASDVRAAKVQSDQADIAARQAEIDSDNADVATQQAAIGLDAQGIGNIVAAVALLQALVTPPVPPTP